MTDWEMELADDELPAEPRKPRWYTVAVYDCDKSFGGPEEGGWWFDCGTRCDDYVPTIHLTVEDARKAAREMQEELDNGPNNDGGNHDLSSVCCTGRLMAYVEDEYPAKYFPEVRPHYE